MLPKQNCKTKYKCAKIWIRFKATRKTTNYLSCIMNRVMGMVRTISVATLTVVIFSNTSQSFWILTCRKTLEYIYKFFWWEYILVKASNREKKTHWCIWWCVIRNVTSLILHTILHLLCWLKRGLNIYIYKRKHIETKTKRDSSSKPWCKAASYMIGHKKLKRASFGEESVL